MQEKKGCCLVKILDSQACSIDYCPECRVVHLNLEFVSLKFKRDGFGALGQVLLLANQKMETLDQLKAMEDSERIIPFMPLLPDASRLLNSIKRKARR